MLRLFFYSPEILFFSCLGYLQGYLKIAKKTILSEPAVGVTCKGRLTERLKSDFSVILLPFVLFAIFYVPYFDSIDSGCHI